MKLPRRASAIPILGIGAQRNSVSNGLVSLTIISRVNSTISLEINALVLSKLTAYLPPAQVEYSQWSHLQGLPLADQDFANPGKIDLVLGANVYSQILEEGLCRGRSSTPIAQKTTRGWILSGPLPNNNFDSIAVDSYSTTGLQCSLDFELLELLQRFWTQEEVSRSHLSLSPDEAQCEHHFTSTYSRDSAGRFVVQLPLKRSVSDFGNSRANALNSHLHMKKRFDSNLRLREAFIDFLREYCELDHMRLAQTRSDSPRREFFLSQDRKSVV